MITKPIEIRQYVISRCNERITAAQITNHNIEKYNTACELKYKLSNISAPLLLCKFFLDNISLIRNIIISAAPGTRGYRAYVNKLATFNNIHEFAKTYLVTGSTRSSIDVVIMKQARQN